MTQIKCPILGCQRHLADRQVMCSHHWQLVPETLQLPVRAAKKDRSSPAWRVALEAAVSRVQADEALRKETDIYY